MRTRPSADDRPLMSTQWITIRRWDARPIRGRWREDPSKPKSAEPATAPSGALPASAAAAAPSGDAAPARASVLPAAVAARLHPRSCPRSVLACAETTVETTNDRSSSDRVLASNEETRLEVAHGACRCDTVRDAYHWFPDGGAPGAATGRHLALLPLTCRRKHHCPVSCRRSSTSTCGVSRRGSSSETKGERDSWTPSPPLDESAAARSGRE